MQIPNKGDIYTPYNFKALQSCSIISKNPNLAKYFNELNDLFINIQILHLIICQVLNPRKGNYAKLYLEDLWFLEKLITNKEIILSSIICSKMINAHAHSKKFLPYGCLLTTFIKTKFQQIWSSSIFPKKQIPIFNHTLLLKMGCIYDETHSKYITVVHRYQRYSHEVDSKNEDEKEDTPAQTALAPH